MMMCWYAIGFLTLMVILMFIHNVDMKRALDRMGESLQLAVNRINRLQDQVNVDELISKAELRDVISGIEVKEE